MKTVKEQEQTENIFLIIFAAPQFLAKYSYTSTVTVYMYTLWIAHMCTLIKREIYYELKIEINSCQYKIFNTTIQIYVGTFFLRIEENVTM